MRVRACYNLRTMSEIERIALDVVYFGYDSSTICIELYQNRFQPLRFDAHRFTALIGRGRVHMDVSKDVVGHQVVNLYYPSGEKFTTLSGLEFIAFKHLCCDPVPSVVSAALCNVSNSLSDLFC